MYELLGGIVLIILDFGLVHSTTTQVAQPLTIAVVTSKQTYR